MTGEKETTRLAKELESALAGEVKFDETYRALYATDSSNYRQVPIGVIFPRDKNDIITAVALCRKYEVPILCRGGGTSLAGQCCNVAVVMDFSKYYNRILEFNQEARTIKVEPGIVLDDLRKEAEKHGLTFGPDPATHNHCTLGGMIGNNSCGVHSVMAAFHGDGARTADFVEEMEVLLYDGTLLSVGPVPEAKWKEQAAQSGRIGEIYRELKRISDQYAPLIRLKFPEIPRRVSGYNLDELLPERNFNVARALSGTESTCVIFLSATLKLIHHFPRRSLVVLGYPDVFESASHVPQILEHKPIGLEGVDDKLIGFMKKKNIDQDIVGELPPGNSWLWVEFGADTAEDAERQARDFETSMRNQKEGPPSIKVFLKEEDQKRIWKVRDSGLGATAFVPGMPDAWEGWEDAAVPPEKLSGYLREFRKLLEKYNYDTTLYGHFGQGCVHCRINFDFTTEKGIDSYKQFTSEAADLVLHFGGSLSGEHGDGQSRGELLVRMYGEELLQAFHEFKRIWDPGWKMNPGKIIDAYPRDSNLRLGKDFSFRKAETHFKFPDDQNNFGRSALRCVGVGECRKTAHGTMCPSYMVTRDEKHSTRGRAHLLFEMMTGRFLKDGWKSRGIKESLDLCLACKGCYGECPVNVDVATYKAEFFSHYYKGKIRPRSAYAFGLIHEWAKWADWFPGIINFFTQTPVVREISKSLMGMDSRRAIPRFEKETFRKWYFRQKRNQTPGDPVILWTDTFNNYFFPDALKSALKVLESAGFNVTVLEKNFCCGRPLYDFGMLDKAENYLRDILGHIPEQIKSGTPVVGLEPSCVSVFRNEMKNLFPDDRRAAKLSNNFFTLAEFIRNNHGKFHFKPLRLAALYHGHCHHKAVMQTAPDIELLEQIGLTVNYPDSGCCGLAGSFGFEKGEKYDLSVQIGERALFPAIRNADPETLLIADGFSCREQIVHGTNRRAFHLAEILEKAL